MTTKNHFISLPIGKVIPHRFELHFQLVSILHAWPKQQNEKKVLRGEFKPSDLFLNNCRYLHYFLVLGRKNKSNFSTFLSYWEMPGLICTYFRGPNIFICRLLTVNEAPQIDFPELYYLKA